MKKTLLTTLLFLLAASAGAQQAPVGQFVMNLDYARFNFDSTQCLLELYYGFYPQLVTLEQAADGSREGFIRFDIELRKKATGESTLNEHFVIPVKLEDSAQTPPSHSLVSAMPYAIPHGSYVLFARAMDSLNQSRRDSITLDVLLKGSPDSICISDLELCSNITRSEQPGGLFHKNSLEVIPNPGLVYGAMGLPVVFSYAEIYNADVGRPYRVVHSVVGDNGSVKKETSRPKTYSSANVVEVGTMNIATIESGRYLYRLDVYDDADSVLLATRDKIFYIHNPHVQPSFETRVSAKAGELAGLSAEELRQEFRYAQYLSTDQERSLFSQLTAEEGMREFLANFWAEIEAGRMGREPISRVDYLRRVATAN